MIILLPKRMSQVQGGKNILWYKTQAKTHKQNDDTDDNPSNKDNDSGSSGSENEFDEKSRYKPLKPLNVPHRSYSNSYTDSDDICSGTTDASTKYHVYNEDLVTFYQKTFLALQNNHFH